jgi:hypothetical protein
VGPYNAAFIGLFTNRPIRNEVDWTSIRTELSGIICYSVFRFFYKYNFNNGICIAAMASTIAEALAYKHVHMHHRTELLFSILYMPTFDPCIES